jgi:hypothetical protein
VGQHSECRRLLVGGIARTSGLPPRQNTAVRSAGQKQGALLRITGYGGQTDRDPRRRASGMADGVSGESTSCAERKALHAGRTGWDQETQLAKDAHEVGEKCTDRQATRRPWQPIRRGHRWKSIRTAWTLSRSLSRIATCADRFCRYRPFSLGTSILPVPRWFCAD